MTLYYAHNPLVNAGDSCVGLASLNFIPLCLLTISKGTESSSATTTRCQLGLTLVSSELNSHALNASVQQQKWTGILMTMSDDRLDKESKQK